MPAKNSVWMLMAETGSGSTQENPAPALPLPDIASLGVGNALRMRREELGWALPQVAAWLRIRESYLEAFEQERGDVFPAEAYALGFLRTYAQALGFDPALVVARYKQEGKAPVRKPELTFPAPPPDRRIPPALTVSLGVAVIVGAYVGWYHFVGHAPPVPEHVPPVAEIIPGEKTANAPSPQVASLLPAPGASPAPPPRPVEPPQGAPPASMPAPAQAGLDTNPPTPGSIPVASTTAPNSMQDDAQLMLKADASSWVQVKDTTGKVVYDHIMQAGDVWAVPKENGPYTLTVGNAGGVLVTLGTVTTPHLGRNGAVRRKIMLTPEAVKDGSLAGAPSVGAGDAAQAITAPPAPLNGQAQPVASQPSGQQSAAPVASVPDMGVSDTSTGVPQAVRPQLHGQHKAVSPPPEVSADDLNARQLQGINQH
ncbi:helix-turn-helix domain-containing protein [Acetobacter orientalis]|nr:helix-turn-helix domain-containing protein [Acetobacter orientalis]